MNVLLDTHVLLWWKGDQRRLSRDARRQIGRTDAVLISPISLWEVATLLRLERIELDRDLFDWTRDLLAEPEIMLAELSAQASVAAGLLTDGFEGDPADRLIYATAADLRVPLVTKDSRLHAFAAHDRAVRLIW